MRHTDFFPQSKWEIPELEVSSWEIPVEFSSHVWWGLPDKELPAISICCQLRHMDHQMGPEWTPLRFFKAQWLLAAYANPWTSRGAFLKKGLQAMTHLTWFLIHLDTSWYYGDATDIKKSRDVTDSWRIIWKFHSKMYFCEPFRKHRKSQKHDAFTCKKRKNRRNKHSWDFQPSSSGHPLHSPRITITSNPTAPSSACRKHSGCSRTRPCPSHFRCPPPLEVDPPVKPRWTSCLGEDGQLRPVPAKTSFQEGDMVQLGMGQKFQTPVLLLFTSK